MSLHKQSQIENSFSFDTSNSSNTFQANPGFRSQFAVLHSSERWNVLSHNEGANNCNDLIADSLAQFSFGVSGQLLMQMSFRSWRDTQLSQLRLVGISPTISQVSVSSQYLSMVS